MAWGSGHTVVEEFARELRCYRAEHGAPTIDKIKAASELLDQASRKSKSPTGGMSETLSSGRISEAMAGKSLNPPTAAMVFSFVRAVLYLEDPSADPVTPSHPDVEELLRLRKRAFARQELGVFRERHLRAALDSDAAGAQHGCFALYALNGTALHIGSTASEPLASGIEAVLQPDSALIDREGVAELELWPLPNLATTPDAEAVVAQVEEALILRALYTTAPATLRLPRRTTIDESAIPDSQLFPLIDAGTLLATRAALRDQATHLANQALARYSRTESLFTRQSSG